MEEKQKKGISKFLSFILRHKPETIGLVLDANGWADVGELIALAASNNVGFSMEELEDIVSTNDKQRFVFNEDHTRIRANQGHSVDIDLKLESKTPPEFLYHGTVEQFITAIRSEGLQKISRQHVHLSKDRETAVKVGSRRGKPVVLMVSSGLMHAEGHQFYESENGVWLTDHVPPRYIGS